MKIIVLLAALVAVSVASDIFGSFLHKEWKRPISFPDWKKGERADGDEMVTLTFAIKQRNIDSLDEIFESVSDPQNKNYGNYVTLSELANLVGSDPRHVASVTQFIRQYAPEAHLQIPACRDFIIAKVSVASAERMLATKFFHYSHATQDFQAIRSPGPYSLPQKIHEIVDFVGGVVRLPKYQFALRNGGVGRPFQDQIDPNAIKSLFNVPASLTGTNANNLQAVAQFLQQYMVFEDLFTFQSTFNLPNQNVTKCLGPNDQTNPGTEAELDIQYITGVAPLVPTWFVSTPGLHEGQEPFLDWITAMINTPNSPLVHSVSYGDYENSVTLDYVTRVNNEFKKFGSMGRSILFASGDDGTGCNNNCTAFVPNFPASSPYVTAVGGIVSNSGNFSGDSISSGGFSNFYGMPAYQKTAVTTYLTQNKQNLPPASFFNVSGRAVPDIASFSENVIVIQSGSQEPVGGTSCASPVVAGIISLLNDARLNAKKPSMGFLNPFIYQTFAAHPDAFFDVTSGNNANGCCSTGFNAAAGWDPVTGVGAPNFSNLLKYAMAV